MGRQRLLVALLGGALLVPLGLAAWLRPDARGYGTHEQLGLRPCTFVVLFGWRCPTCGMTTAWAHLVRGKVTAAVEANLSGTLLGLLGVAAVPWLWVSAWRGRWLAWAPNRTVAAWAGAAILAVTLIDWVFRLCAG